MSMYPPRDTSAPLSVRALLAVTGFALMFCVSSAIWADSAGAIKKRPRKGDKLNRVLNEGSRKKKSCVAYEAEKSLLLVGRGRIYGGSCTLAVTSVKKAGNQLVRIRFDVSTLKSDGETRDREVQALLTSDRHRHISVSALIPTGTRFINDEPVTLDGFLTIKNKKYRINVSVAHDSGASPAQFRVTINTSFSALGMEPPKVAGGAVAEVFDPLKLHGKILLRDLKEAGYLPVTGQ